MKRLYIIRHAKSSWKHQVSDIKRPLKKRGQIDASLVATASKKNFSIPDLVLCSPAKRTKQTAAIFKKIWGIAHSIIVTEEALYDFSGEKLIQVIRQCNDTVNNVMIFAHNFAVTDFVNTFGTIDVNSVPTCGFIVIDFEIASWKNLTKGKTVYTLFPKQLK